MKLTEEQIWKCNQTINYEGGKVVDGVHICLEHQNVVDFARSIEREVGFARAELWIKRINDAVEAEREACAKQSPLTLEWVGLTDEDLKPMCDKWRIMYGSWVHDFVKDIEAKIKEKNSC